MQETKAHVFLPPLAVSESNGVTFLIEPESPNWVAVNAEGREAVNLLRAQGSVEDAATVLSSDGSTGWWIF